MNETYYLSENSTAGIQDFSAKQAGILLSLKQDLTKDILKDEFEPTQKGYINNLFDDFVFSTNPNSIIDFLNENAFLLPIIFEAEDKINFFFNKNEENLKLVNLRLEKFLNPETNEEKIILTIILNATPEKAFERFKEFRNAWWLDTVKKTNWKLAIDMDFM